MDEQKKLGNSDLDETGSARRRLLKAAGLSTVAGLVTLDWRKPSVHLGTLPAHAQPGSCDPLFIPGGTISCGSPSFSLLEFIVDDTGSCPVLLPDTGQSQGTPAQLALVFQDATSLVRVSFEVLETEEESDARLTQQCVISPRADDSIDFSLPFPASSGAIWTASFTLSRDSTSVTITDVLLTPLP